MLERPRSDAGVTTTWVLPTPTCIEIVELACRFKVEPGISPATVSCNLDTGVTLRANPEIGSRLEPTAVYAEIVEAGRAITIEVEAGPAVTGTETVVPAIWAGIVGWEFDGEIVGATVGAELGGDVVPGFVGLGVGFDGAGATEAGGFTKVTVNVDVADRPVPPTTR